MIERGYLFTLDNALPFIDLSEQNQGMRSRFFKYVLDGQFKVTSFNQTIMTTRR